MREVQKWKKVLIYLMVFALVFSFMPASTVSAATNNKAVKKVTIKNGSETVTKKTITLEKGTSTKLKVTVSPSKAKKKVTYSTSKKSVAKVSKSGKITAVGNGTAKITVTVTGKNGKKKKTYVKVKVVDKLPETPAAPDTPNTPNTPATPDTPSVVEVTGVTATASPSGQINVGGTCTIVASVTPANATDKTLTYTSSDPSVATVNATGVVLGINEGSAQIRVKASNGKYADVPVTVSKVPVESITLSQTKIDKLSVGSTVKLTATVLPENATNPTVKWTSSKNEVATVTDGVVTGISAGTATITASTENGVSAKCEVTVIEETNIANGVTLKMTNPYTDNSGVVYPNTQLVGTGAVINISVVKDGVGLGNEPIKLELTPNSGNAPDCFEVTLPGGKSLTEADGTIKAVIDLKNDYGELNALSEVYQNYTLKVTAQSVGYSEAISVSFASIQLKGITVENNNPSSVHFGQNFITPAPEVRKQGGDGISVTKSTEMVDPDVRIAVDGKTIEYVSSQQDTEKTTDHTVYFDATPVLLTPAADKAYENKTFEWTAGKTVGNCHVYNEATNEDTRVEIANVPGGLQYITLYFDKLKLSKYTAIYVDVYPQAGGAALCHKEITSDNNKDTSSTVQIKQTFDVPSYIVVSMVTQGQVDTANEGYVLTKVEAPYITKTREDAVEFALENAVKWEKVNIFNDYTSQEISEADVKAYLPEDSKYFSSDANYKYTYKYQLPPFPKTGNAIFTVETKTTTYYLSYPTVKDEDTNVNVLAAPGIYRAVPMAAEELNATGTISSTGNSNEVAVNSTTNGRTALKASLNIEGIDSSILNEQKNGILYTSVHWVTEEITKEEEVAEDYFAIENQDVEVTAQVYGAGGKNPAEPTGADLQFYYTDNNGEKVKITGTPQNGQAYEIIGEGVEVKSFERVQTEGALGKFKFKLHGTDIKYVEGITAECGNYIVKLKIGDEATAKEVKKANIYWVDLGVSYVNNAVTDDDLYGTNKTYQYSEDPYRITQFNESNKEQVKSTYNVGEKWEIGYQVVAKSHKFNYTTIEKNDGGEKKEVERPKLASEFISVDNVPLTYAQDGIETKVFDNTSGKYAVIQTSKEGKIGFSGTNSLIKSDDTKKVVFNFYNEDGEKVSYTNVGVGDIVNGATGTIDMDITWGFVGLKATVINPNGTKIASNTATTLYVKVTDDYGNVRKKYPVSYSATLNSNVTTGSGVTDDNGVYAIELKAPYEEGTCKVDITVDGNQAGAADIQNSIDIVYANAVKNGTDAPRFGLGTPAVRVEDAKTIKVYFTNGVNADTIRKNGIFELTDSNNGKVTVEAERDSITNSCVVLKLTEGTLTYSDTYKLTVKQYVDKENITYQLIDSYGQKLTGTSTTTFKPLDITTEADIVTVSDNSVPADEAEEVVTVE